MRAVAEIITREGDCDTLGGPGGRSPWASSRTFLISAPKNWLDLRIISRPCSGHRCLRFVASRWQRSVDDGEIGGAKAENNALR